MRPFGVFLLTLLLLAPGARAEELLFGTTEWPPYAWLENGDIRGTEVEVVRAVFTALNLPFSIEMFPWKRCEKMARQKELTGIFPLGRTPAREEYLIFPRESLSLSENVFFVRKDKPYTYRSREDLDGLFVGITEGYDYGRLLTGIPGLRLDPANEDAAGFRKLQADRIDLFLCDKRVGRYLIEKMGLTETITWIPKPFSQVDLFIGFIRTPENEELARRFDAVLRDMKRFGKYQRILDTPQLE